MYVLEWLMERIVRMVYKYWNTFAINLNISNN